MNHKLTLLIVGIFITSVLWVRPSSAASLVEIQGPARIGAKTDRPFVFLIPATGATPRTYSAVGLPLGLSLNAQSGIITGVAKIAGSYPVKLIVANKVSSSSKVVEFVVGDKAVALTPVMGWNPWYVWGCNVNDRKIRKAADLLVSTGLAAHGYNYINLDDCWQGHRNSKGAIVPDDRFPNMKALATYVHRKGLRLGIYTSPGTETCARNTGSFGHVDQDVQTYAKWGMDLIKYDLCGFEPDGLATYRQLSDAIELSSRSMVHMICQYGKIEVWKWGAQAGGNSWRTNDDLADVWGSILRNGFANLPLASFAGQGHWNDLDMLMVGKSNWPKRLGDFDIPDQPPRPTQLTLDEQYTHISLWSLMASPLLFSGDLAQIDATTLSLLTNDEVIAIDQDALGKPGQLMFEQNGAKVVTRPLADGSMAVGLFNLNETPSLIHLDVTQLGLKVGQQVKIRDLWKRQDLKNETSAITANVPAHGVSLLKVTLD